MRTRACAHACFVGVEERLFTLEDRRDSRRVLVLEDAKYSPKDRRDSRCKMFVDTDISVKNVESKEIKLQSRRQILCMILEGINALWVR